MKKFYATEQRYVMSTTPFLLIHTHTHAQKKQLLYKTKQLTIKSDQICAVCATVAFTTIFEE